jgi:hypothetical protein
VVFFLCLILVCVRDFQVNVEDSEDGLANGAFSARTAAEEKKLKKRPSSVRLACQVVCQGGDATVSTKP